MVRRRLKPSRMSQVAERAGVSQSTVSRALAGSPLISEKTRRAVEKAATSLDYRVDAAGSSLRTGLSRTIGVVIPLAHAEQQQLSDPFFLEMIGALADELSAIGHSLLLSKVTGDPSAWITEAVRQRRVDGVIVVGQSVHHEQLNALADQGVPLIAWGAQLKDQRYLTVGSDNELGGETAASHLIAQGCRRIAFLGDRSVPEVAARLKGYRRALRAAGMDRDRHLEVSVRFGGEAAWRETLALLDRDVGFDGIVACSDALAMSAMRALSERGIGVPAQVAVVGFDDVPLAAVTSPPLTTIRQDCRSGARWLVRNIMHAVRHEQTASIVIPTELVVRESSLSSQVSSGRR